MPQVTKGDLSPMRQLINSALSHMNALQALSLNVPFHELILDHLKLATIDPETQREWENGSSSSLRAQIPQRVHN